MWAIVKGLTSGVQDQTQGFEGWTVNVNQSGAKINVRITFQVSDYFTTFRPWQVIMHSMMNNK